MGLKWCKYNKQHFFSKWDFGGVVSGRFGPVLATLPGRFWQVSLAREDPPGRDAREHRGVGGTKQLLVGLEEWSK